MNLKIIAAEFLLTTLDLAAKSLKQLKKAFNQVADTWLHKQGSILAKLGYIRKGHATS